MSDHQLEPTDDQLAARIAELAQAPDRGDWNDVRTRAGITAQPRRGWHLPNSFRLVAVATSCLALAGLLAVLLILAPDSGTSPPARPPARYVTLPAVPAAQIPENVRDTLQRLPGAPDSAPQTDRPIARILTARTPQGTFTIWRVGSRSGEYFDSIQRNNSQGGGAGGACFGPWGGVVPPDPPGTPPQVPLPNVVGLPFAEATRVLEEAGLQPKLYDSDPVTGAPHSADPAAPVTAVLNGYQPLRAGGRIFLSTVQNESVLPGNDDVVPCMSGGGVHSGAVSARVASLALVWPDGSTTAATIENGNYLLALPPNDCVHPEPPAALVAQDADSTEISRFVRGDSDFSLVMAGWDAQTPPACGPAPNPAGAAFSVLDRAPVLSDDLPAWASDDPAFRDIRQGASVAVRRATTVADRIFSVARIGTGAKARYCVIDTQVTPGPRPSDGRTGGPGGPGGITCAQASTFERDLLTSQFALHAEADPTKVTVDMAGLVPDGFTVTVDGHDVPVTGNVFVVSRAASNPRVVATGPDGTIVHFPQGPAGGRPGQRMVLGK